MNHIKDCAHTQVSRLDIISLSTYHTTFKLSDWSEAVLYIHLEHTFQYSNRIEHSFCASPTEGCDHEMSHHPLEGVQKELNWCSQWLHQPEVATVLLTRRGGGCILCQQPIPTIEESRDGPNNYQYTVSPQTKNSVNVMTQMCNCNPYIVLHCVGFAVTHLCQNIHTIPSLCEVVHWHIYTISCIRSFFRHK